MRTGVPSKRRKLRLFEKVDFFCEESEKIIIRLAIAACAAKVVFEVVVQHLLK